MPEFPNDPNMASDNQAIPPTSPPKQVVIQPQDQWIKRVLRDTFQGFIRSPIPIFVAACILTIPLFFSSKIDYSKLFTFDAQGIPNLSDYSKILPYTSEIFTDFILAFIAKAIAYSLVFHWANRMRLDKPFSLIHYFEGLATVPRIVFGILVEFAIILAVIILTYPVFALSAFSKLFITIWFMLIFSLGIFLILKWFPRFDYFLAGMATTREPFRVLLHEWWDMPRWLWLRFLSLFAYRVMGMGIVIIVMILVTFLSKESMINEAISTFLVDIVGLIFIAATAVAFARGRDEWADVSEWEESTTQVKE